MRPDSRLAVPVAFAWGLLALLLAAPQALAGAAAGCIGATLALVGATLLIRSPVHRSLMLGPVLAAALSALILASAAAALPDRSAPSLIEAAERGHAVRAEAVLTEAVHGPEGGRFTARMVTGTSGSGEFAGSVPVVAFGALERPAGVGARVQLVGTLVQAQPGDAAAFLLYLTGTGSVSAAPPDVLRIAGSLRDGFRRVAASLPGDGGDLLPGLAVGDTTAVGDDLDSAMKRTSLSHLTAVSGANCAVIIALVMVLGSAAGIPRGWRIALSIAVLVGFVILVTPEPSVLRAGVMATLVLAATASGRPARGLPVLAVAVLGLLAVDPWLARDFGFVLSVCATAGLLLLAAPLARWLSRWLPLPLALLVAVPAAAQFACQPVLILLTPAIPTYGVVANILAAPAAPVATVLGLIACVSLPWAPLLGEGAARLAWLPSSWIAAVAEFFAGLPGAGLPWPPGAWGAALAVAVGGLAVAVWVVRKRSWRLAAAGLLLAALVSYVGTVGGEEVRRRLSPPPDWVVAACDVGQGDAMLLRSGGQVALIDAGPDPALLAYCLDTLGVARIDLLVLSHFDLDHVGGVEAVVGRADRVLVGPSSGADDDRVVERLAASGSEVEQVARGTGGSLGQHEWTVLWPPVSLAGVRPGNDASVVVHFAPAGDCADGCLSSLFLGDLGELSQSRMLALSRPGAVDVVKVSHHGSRDQSDALYRRLRAAVGLIGVGSDNGYGHPTDQALALLAAMGTHAVRTDRTGLALVALRNDELHLWTERGGVAGGE